MPFSLGTYIDSNSLILLQGLQNTFDILCKKQLLFTNILILSDIYCLREDKKSTLRKEVMSLE